MTSALSPKARWQERLRDPIWQFWGVIATVIALAITMFATYDLYYRQQTDIEVHVKDYFDYRLYWPGDPSFGALTVKYREKPVDNAYAIFFTLSNEGNKPIAPVDYVTPITLKLEPSAEIADAQIVGRTPSSLDFQITRVNTDTVQLSPSLFNPGDSMRIVLTVVNRTDLTQSRLVDISRIPGMAQITFESDQGTVRTGFVQGTFTFSFRDLLFVALVTAMLIGATVFLLRRIVGSGYFEKYAGIKIAVIAFMTGALLFWATMLARALLGRASVEYWQFWGLPTFVGALLAVAYIAYLLNLLRTGVKRKRDSLPPTH